jgi:hypothetical protein
VLTSVGRLKIAVQGLTNLKHFLDQAVSESEKNKLGYTRKCWVADEVYIGACDWVLFL